MQDHDALDFLKADIVGTTIIVTSCTGAFVVRHLLRDLDFAAVA